MKSFKLAFNLWLWKMAWRDSRSHRKRLLMFITSIIFGIAALVSISSFGENLQTAIDEQAKTLLGADLMISGLQPFSKETETMFDSIGGEQANELLFASMAYFPKNGGTRLVQVRAMKGDFPFYGDIVTDPKEAAISYKTGSNVLVDNALMLQFNVTIGDTIKIGNVSYAIAGRLIKLPTDPPVASTFSPRIYLPAKYLDRSLLQRGSLVNYRKYFKLSPNRNAEELKKKLQPKLNRYRLRAVTVTQRKQNISDIMANLYRFLNLVGFVALILGCIGVASSVHVYIKEKFSSISILRCLGLESKEAFTIYLIQIIVLTIIGSMAGALLGVGIQWGLPDIFHDFLPVQMDQYIAWWSVLKGFCVGISIALLFSLFPLIPIKNVSPLLALRAGFKNERANVQHASKWFLSLLIIGTMLVFAIRQTKDIQTGLIFTGGVVVAFAILTVVARSFTFLLKKYFPDSWSYIWRQGLANLFRPNNQTWILMTSIGLGTFLITTLYLSHHTLLNKITYVGGAHKPNLVLFDIQPDQNAKVKEILHSLNMPIMQEAPMVTMRIETLKGKSVTEILNETNGETRGYSTAGINKGLLSWEYRTTYRDSLFASETIVAGKWQGTAAKPVSVVPLSFEERAAKQLHVSIGDTIVWNVQGVRLTSVVTSLRKVDWQRIQANFMALFPAGVLEAAPQIYILATRADNAKISATLQKSVIQAYPNISIIDLALVLDTIDGLLNKISFVIQFMAFFSIFTGLLVLAAAVISSRFQRIQENILLKTLGASKKQIIQIVLVEYIFLGELAAITGLMLAYGAGWALAYFIFDAVFLPAIWPFFAVSFVVTGLTVLIGMLNNHDIFDRPPLEVLRVEG